MKLKILGELKLPPMDGQEIAPGVWLVGEPVPIPDTNKFRCLANVDGMLAAVELSVRFPKAP